MSGSLTIIGGLPGSGKTTLMKSMETDVDLVLDDYPYWYKEVGPSLRKLARQVQNHRVVITGQWHGTRLQAQMLDLVPEITWIWFERNIPACLANIVHDGLYKDPHARHGHSRLNCVIAQTDKYKPPEGALPIQAHTVSPEEVSGFFLKFPRTRRNRDEAMRWLGLDLTK